MSNEAVEKFLSNMLAEIEQEAATKVTKAVRLWIQCDNNYKFAILNATGFDTRMLVCPCATKHLREHFDTMELMDELDSCIEDMESDIRNAARTDA